LVPFVGALLAVIFHEYAYKKAKESIDMQSELLPEKSDEEELSDEEENQRREIS
jgi:hypothetical protein